MGHATFELVCALCQTLMQPAQPASFWDEAWAAEERALLAEARTQEELATMPAPPALRQPGIGTRRTLADGRELRMNLTPTPAQCAPLLELTF